MFPLFIMHIMFKDVNDNATFQYISLSVSELKTSLSRFWLVLSLWFTIQQIEKDIGAGSLAKYWKNKVSGNDI